MSKNPSTAPIRKIVVATDFSSPSNRAFDFAIRLATEMQAEVIGVFVKDADDLAIALRQNIPVKKSEISKLKDKVNRVIEDQFQAVLRDRQNARKIRFVILEGNPSEQILQLARKEKADLIVSGTRGRSLLSNMLLGSTARDLIIASPVPVITVNDPVPQQRVR